MSCTKRLYLGSKYKHFKIFEIDYTNLSVKKTHSHLKFFILLGKNKHSIHEMIFGMLKQYFVTLKLQNTYAYLPK